MWNKLCMDYGLTRTAIIYDYHHLWPHTHTHRTYKWTLMFFDCGGWGAFPHHIFRFMFCWTVRCGTTTTPKLGFRNRTETITLIVYAWSIYSASDVNISIMLLRRNIPHKSHLHCVFTGVLCEKNQNVYCLAEHIM